MNEQITQEWLTRNAAVIETARMSLDTMTDDQILAVALLDINDGKIDQNFPGYEKLRGFRLVDETYRQASIRPTTIYAARKLIESW